MFCSCCAAGDIAKAAGRDYCMSCCIIPFCVGIIAPCWWSYDRQALAQRLNIVDPFSGSGECASIVINCYQCLSCSCSRSCSLHGCLLSLRTPARSTAPTPLSRFCVLSALPLSTSPSVCFLTL